MSSKKNLSALFLSVSVSLIYALCGISLTYFFDIRSAFSATAPFRPSTFQCGMCFLYILLPFFFVFMLMRTQISRLVLVQSELKTANDTLEDRVKSRTAELEKSIDDIKILKGIITICANCKDIRNGQGQWEPVEMYVERHSEVRFSHGLCNDCLKALYGDNYSRFATVKVDTPKKASG